MMQWDPFFRCMLALSPSNPPFASSTPFAADNPHRTPIQRVFYHDHYKQYLSVSRDGAVCAWSASTFQPVRAFVHKVGEVDIDEMSKQAVRARLARARRRRHRFATEKESRWADGLWHDMDLIQWGDIKWGKGREGG